MAASLSSFDILSLLMCCILPFPKYYYIKQSNFDLFFIRCTYCLPSDLMGYRYGSPFVSWCIHAFPPLLRFFSLNVAPYAFIIYLYFAFFPNQRKFTPFSFLKHNISISINICSCFLSDVIAYHPIRNKKQNLINYQSSIARSYSVAPYYNPFKHNHYGMSTSTGSFLLSGEL